MKKEQQRKKEHRTKSRGFHNVVVGSNPQVFCIMHLLQGWDEEFVEAAHKKKKKRSQVKNPHKVVCGEGTRGYEKL